MAELTRNRQAETILTVSYVFYVVLSIIDTTDYVNFIGPTTIDLLLKMARVFCLGLLAIAVLLSSQIDQTYMVMALLFTMLCACITVFSNAIAEFFVPCVFIACGWIVISDRYLKVYLIASIALLSLTVLLDFVGVYTQSASQDFRGYRFNLGFQYTTLLPNYFFHCVLVYFVLKRKSISIPETAILFFVNLGLYLLTGTRAVFYELILLLVAMWLLRAIPRFFKTRLFKWLAISVMPLLAVLIFILAFAYDPQNQLLRLANRMLSGRLSLAHNAIEQFGLHPLGTEVVWLRPSDYPADRANYVDSSYVAIGIRYGFLFLIWIVAAFSAMTAKAWGERKFCLCIVIAILALHSFTDPQLLSIKYDPLLLMLLVSCAPRLKLPIGVAIE